MRVPFYSCVPNYNYTCVVEGDDAATTWFVGAKNGEGDYFSGYGMFSFEG